MRGSTTQAAAALLCAAGAAGIAPRPHIISILQDDLGFYDIQNGMVAGRFTKNLTGLISEGILLTNHYTHWHCSPTRRSFLTGRLPIHHGEQLSDDGSDDIDLRMTWVSQKLKEGGYQTHWYGKYHTGFRSMNHLGMRRGFDNSVGSFQTGGAYSGPQHSMRWQNDHPIWQDQAFDNKPAGCPGGGSESFASWLDDNGKDEDANQTGQCDPTSWHNNTQMQCGILLNKSHTDTPAECCARCVATPGCSFWVYGGQSGDNCHVKAVRGKPCFAPHSGFVAGQVAAAPTPAPLPTPPPAPTPPTCVDEYSTDLWGQEAVQAVRQFDTSNTSARLYIHLCFQAVHEPYNKAPGDPTSSVYIGMLWRADVFIGAIVDMLKLKLMYNNTLIVYSADNGGVGPGINWPLRGEKHSNWEGGMRTAAFVSGGFIPKALQGTNNSVTIHIVDWYSTFASLAGVDATDDPPVPPLPVDINNPDQNIYGEKSFPPLDGVDVWPMLSDPSSHAIDSAHKHLVLSKEVLIAGKWKLLVSQPHLRSQNPGWKDKDGKWRQPIGDEIVPCQVQDADPVTSFLPVPGNGGVCLFDIRADPGEHKNLAASNLDVVAELYAALNQTILTLRDCHGWSYKGRPNGRIPGPLQADNKTTSCSPPELLGYCDTKCAQAKWRTYGNYSSDGPHCDVPGCTGPGEVEVG